MQEFTVSGLTYKMPFYDDEFPPCDGRPGPDGIDADTVTWAIGADWEDPSCVPRELRAAEVFCGRLEPYPYGCAEYLAAGVGASLARAERRRFQMTSPFGYDYYLSLGELRDADNATLIHAYLDGVEPLPAKLVEVNANLTRLNASLEFSEATHEAARRALAVSWTPASPPLPSSQTSL